MVGIFVVFVLGIGLVAGKAHGTDQDQVDAAIVNIELHYNDKLCLELLLVDCTKHVTVGDEKVCGSNGITYENHCRFTHAICEYRHSHPKLKVANHGECLANTVAPSGNTNAPVATTMDPTATTMAPAATTMAPGQTTMAPAATTMAPAATTMAPVATKTTAMPTTTDPINSILQNVFCQNAGTISCADGFKIICGTDGQLYPNECELSKAKCNNPSLTITDNSQCALP